jgi:hypothetical protein
MTRERSENVDFVLETKTSEELEEEDASEKKRAEILLER